MTRRSITTATLALVAVSTALQLGALAVGGDSLAAGTTARTVFSTVEMALVLGLVVVDVAIVRWTRTEDRAPIVRTTAWLALASLVLCALGDLVNRNYPNDFYVYDDVIRHSYLVTSIWFFAPGYALVVVAIRHLTAERVRARVALLTVAAATVVGLAAYLGNHDGAVALQSSTLIASYGVVLAILAGSTTWLVRAYGWSASRIVVVGCLLAPVADALIANLWLYRDHYPTIEHVNWIIYFASLAMIGRITFLAADEHPSGADAGAAA